MEVVSFLFKKEYATFRHFPSQKFAQLPAKQARAKKRVGIIHFLIF